MICHESEPNIATLCCGAAVHLNCMAKWLADAPHPSCIKCVFVCAWPPVCPKLAEEEEDESLITDLKSGIESRHLSSRLHMRGVSRFPLTTHAVTGSCREALPRPPPRPAPAPAAAAAREDEAASTTSDLSNALDDDGWYQSPLGSDEDTTSSSTGDAGSTAGDDETTTSSGPGSPVPPARSAGDRSWRRPKCQHCNNVAAGACENSSCGSCCLQHGLLFCLRHQS